MLDFDEERKQIELEKKEIQIKEILIEEIITNEDKFKKYFNELLKVFNYQDIENKVNEIYNNLLKFKENGTAIIIGAFDKNNDLIGFIWGYQRINKIHINYFYIEQEYRKLGIGKKLINTIYEKAKNLNILEIELIVSPKNTNAIIFYEKQGFISERILLCKKI